MPDQVTPETVQTLCEQLRAKRLKCSKPPEHPWCSDLMRDAADLLESLLGEVERLRQENHVLTARAGSAEAVGAYYSGDRSKLFWDRVNAADDMLLYIAACALQSHEGRMHQMLEYVERLKVAHTPRPGGTA